MGLLNFKMADLFITEDLYRPGTVKKGARRTTVDGTLLIGEYKTPGKQVRGYAGIAGL